MSDFEILNDIVYYLKKVFAFGKRHGVNTKAKKGMSWVLGWIRYQWEK